VLRGEPLVPLSDVTFAEEADRAGRRPATGRNGRGNGHRDEAVVTITPSRKRAAAASKTG
jgi:hypothetical protein